MHGIRPSTIPYMHSHLVECLHFLEILSDAVGALGSRRRLCGIELWEDARQGVLVHTHGFLPVQERRKEDPALKEFLKSLSLHCVRADERGKNNVLRE